MSLSLTLNRYLTLLWCFNCYCWTCTSSKVNNGIIRKKCAICSELTIKTPEQRHDDFEQCRITWRKKILADCKTTSFQLKYLHVVNRSRTEVLTLTTKYWRLLFLSLFILQISSYVMRCTIWYQTLQNGAWMVG